MGDGSNHIWGSRHRIIDPCAETSMDSICRFIAKNGLIGLTKDARNTCLKIVPRKEANRFPFVLAQTGIYANLSAD